MISRRSLLQVAGLSALLGFLGCKVKNKQNKPNVLFISIDDLNDWIGSLRGHPQAKTPNIDRLMQSSTSFTDAHCAAPVCGASRNSLLSGRHPTTTGWYTNAGFEKNAEKVLYDIPTLPEYFKQNGYRTLAGGKVFHTGTSDYREAQWDTTLPHYEITNEDLLARGNGYGNGKYGSKDHKYYPFPKNGGQIATHFGPDTPGKSLCWGALERNDIPKNGIMPDEYIAQWAVSQLNQKQVQPFFMAVGFIRPHVPFTAPQEYFDLFPLENVQMPEIKENEMKDIPLFGKAMALGIIPEGDHNAVTQISPTFWKELVRANLACIAFVDAQIGKVLNALENSRYKNNTITVLWSDHGQNFGEHRNWRKMTLWQESTHVPLSIRVPNQTTGLPCKQTVSLLDLYPTLSELCGLSIHPSNEGISLVPWLKQPKLDKTTPVICTWGYKNHAVINNNWRYIRYRDQTEELYQRKDDPNEHVNLANKKEFTLIKQHLSQFLPTHNELPPGMETFTGDFLDQKIKKMQSGSGIPDWLL